MNSMIMDTQKKRTQKLESPEMTAAMTAVNTLVDYAAILAKNGVPARSAGHGKRDALGMGPGGCRGRYIAGTNGTSEGVS